MKAIRMTAPSLVREGYVLQYFNRGDLKSVKPTLANFKRIHGDEVRFDCPCLYDGENVWEFGFGEKTGRGVYIELWRD
jgi:hypothetical protein